MQVQAVAFACFAEDDYESFRRLLPQRRWHADYAGWRHAHEQGMQALRDKGGLPIEQEVRSEGFAAWCRVSQRQLDTQSLTGYAVELAQLRIHSGDQTN